MPRDVMAERSVFLSTVPASDNERRITRIAVLTLCAIFLLAAPFARVKLAEVWAFIPSYQSAQLVIDLITAVLLFAQFAILGAQALLVLAGGYLFSALISVPHTLSFPRLFAPEGLIGGGPQTTAWLYMIWRAGFPIAVIAYVSLRDSARVQRPGLAIATACAAVMGIVVAATMLTTLGHTMLPTITRGEGYTPVLTVVIFIVWSLSLGGALVLWRQPNHSVLDRWLIVVMWAWMFDIALSTMLNAGRFDLGFYAGRIFGLMATSLVLLVLLLETGLLYARLARSFEIERRDRDRQLHEVQSELIHVSRLTELGQMVSALAHEVNQPLTAVSTYVRAGRRLIQAGDTVKADEALSKATEQATRASQVIQRLRNFVKKEDSHRRVEDIQHTIEEVTNIALVGTEGRRVTLQMQIAPDTRLVFIDKVQIQQVLLNLTRNAVEAMQSSAQRDLVITTTGAGGGMLEVGVADSGPGLDPEVRAKLFQPFVTTKSAGMGVGLSICRSIIEAHGGRIWVTERPGGGTQFHFTLPGPALDGPTSEPEPQPSMASELDPPRARP